jgi:hypothetical protein
MATTCTDVSLWGVDLISECFRGPAGTTDPAFVAACTNAFYCTFNTADPCKDDVRGPIACYCGANTTLDSCEMVGKGPTGPCIDPWLVATGCDAMFPSGGQPQWACVLSRIEATGSPSYAANSLTLCKDVVCTAECTGVGP